MIPFHEFLGHKKNIVVITGAGISTNSGVDDFRTSRSSKSSRNIFDLSAYSSPDSAEKLHDRLFDIFKSALDPHILPFEAFMEDLAKNGRLQRHYTQNIDARTASNNLPFLAEKTVWLHGRLDRMICHKYAQHEFAVTPTSFFDQLAAICPTCQAGDLKRTLRGKRPHACGKLRPKVLLYGECCPNESNIVKDFQSDLDSPPDAVLIVGTRLLIPSLRKFAMNLCENVGSGGLVAWINLEQPALGTKFDSIFNYKYIGDYDVLLAPFVLASCEETMN